MTPTPITKAQRKSIRSLMRRWQRRPDEMRHAFFVNCLMVRYDNLWIGIETDGYTHT